MRSKRVWWVVFTASAVVLTLALVWMTIEVLRLERAEAAARAEAAHQESLRLALWRMDSWFSPHLARESARQYFDYQTFRPEELAYTKMLQRLEAEEVLTPSPLLSFDSDLIRLHFETTPDGVLTSPQVPLGNERDLVEATYVDGEKLAVNAGTLDALRGLITPTKVEECVAVCSAVATAPVLAETPAAPAAQRIAQQAMTEREWGQRQLATANTNDPGSAQQGPGQQWLAYSGEPVDSDAPAAPNAMTVEPLVPMWLPAAAQGATEGATEELIFVRRVRLGERVLLQGFLCDWPRLRASLLGVVDDLFPTARLTPVIEATTRAAGFTLATIPARLDVSAAPAPAMAMMSPARATLALTWVAVVVGLLAVAITLRASIVFGERRARFASAVTHELRTPLTTFRMYSEMLAEGMVSSEEQRQTYLTTLRDESDRLAALVENVLAYARLERGRERVERAATTLGALVEGLRPRLERQTDRAGMTLAVDVADADAATSLVTDPEAVGQILVNLIENACKYASDAADPTVHVDARRRGDDVQIEVRDHGGGIAPEHARIVFAPFERGARSAGDPTPGVGLGLALARGLARTLGGDLRLRAGTADSGACFRLVLPKA